MNKKLQAALNTVKWKTTFVKVGSFNNLIETFWHAVDAGNSITVRVILQNNPDTKKFLEYSDSWPLARASERGNIELVKTLLEFGSDPNARKGAALLIAVGRQNLELTELLLEKGSDPNARNGACLVRAMQDINGPMVELLIRYGADPNLLPLSMRSSVGCFLTPSDCRK